LADNKEEFDDIENEGEIPELPEGAMPEKPPTYEELVQEEPERKINIENIEVSKGSVGEDEEDDLVSASDFKAALGAITPKFASKRMNDILQPIMMSRVFPDNYLDLNYVLTTMMIEELEGQNDIDFLQILTGNQVATSKAYEGKHIIDIAELYGAARDEEMDKLGKELGL
jgi:hypothetical protein